MELTSKDQQLISDVVHRRFTDEEIEQHQLLSRKVDNDFLRELGGMDLQFYCRFFLADHFFCEPASMHQVAFKDLQDLIDTPGKANEDLVFPRGFAKTTIADLGLVSWCTYYRLRRHMVIISDSLDQSKDQLLTLKDEIEANERLNEVFGDIVGPLWQQEEIETSTGIKIRALGWGMKIRGRKYKKTRPDLIIVDDPQELVGVQSAVQRKADRAHFFRSIMKAGWSDTKVLVIGNFIHHDCLLRTVSLNAGFKSRIYKALPHLPSDMGLWELWQRILMTIEDPEREDKSLAFYKEHEKEMLEGAESAWPQAFSVYDLMKAKAVDGESSFACEMQNDPRDPSKALFKQYDLYHSEMVVEQTPGLPEVDVWLVPHNGTPRVRLSQCAIFGFCDPSMGASSKSDRSAITLVAKAPSRRLFVLVADIKRRPPTQIMSDQIKYAREYALTRFGIEKNQFQAFFATQSAREALELDVNLPVVAVNQTANKSLRISSLEPDFSNGLLLLPQHGCDDLKDEISYWSPDGKDDDDGLDSLEGARTLARAWESIQNTSIVQGSTHTFLAERPSDDSDDPYAEWEAIADKAEQERVEEEKEPEECQPLPFILIGQEHSLNRQG